MGRPSKLTPRAVARIRVMRCMEGLTLRAIADKIGVHTMTVSVACRKRGWKHPNGFRPDTWSPADDTRLREMYPAGAALDDIAAALDRDTTPGAVTARARAIGLRRLAECRGGRPASWTPADIAILREMYPDGATMRDIVDALSGTKSRNAVWKKASDLGLRRRPEPELPEKPGPERTKRPRKDRLREVAFEDLVTTKPATPSRDFSEIEKRRVQQFAARGDTHADIARQLRCDVDDIRRVAGVRRRTAAGDCGGAGAR